MILLIHPQTSTGSTVEVSEWISNFAHGCVVRSPATIILTMTAGQTPPTVFREKVFQITCMRHLNYTNPGYFTLLHPYKSVWYISHAEHFISNQKRRGCMKETRMPPAKSANLVANSGNTICGVSVILLYVTCQWSSPEKKTHVKKTCESCKNWQYDPSKTKQDNIVSILHGINCRWI